MKQCANAGYGAEMFCSHFSFSDRWLQNMNNMMLNVNKQRVREAKLPAKEGPGRFFSRQVETAPAVSVKWPATLRNLP